MSSIGIRHVIFLLLVNITIALTLHGTQVTVPPNVNPTRTTQAPPEPTPSCNRRSALSKIIAATGATTGISIGTLPFVRPASARAPGSENVTEAVLQIRDAADDLRRLQREWDLYAVVDVEGRAGNNTDGARRILGGIAPQAGTAAIEVAKVTPLYRIDRAFTVVRRASIDAVDKDSWGFRLDIATFEEISERVLFELQKADGDFYSVNFAMKGSIQITGIYKEAKIQVDRGIIDLDNIVGLLRDVEAPGL